MGVRVGVVAGASESGPGRYLPALAAALGICVAVVSTVGLSTGLGRYDEQRYAITLALCLFGLLVCRKGEFVAPSALTAAFLAALVIGLLSSLAAPRPYAALLEWATLGLVVATAWALPRVDSRTLSLAAAAFALPVAAIYSVGIAANYAAAVTTGYPIGVDTFVVGLSNRRFPAQLQTLTLPLLPLAWLLAPSRRWRMFIACLSALWWCALFGSGSRTGWLASLGGVLAIAWAGSAGRRLLGYQLATAVFGAVLYGLAFVAIPLLAGLPTEFEPNRFADGGSVFTRLHLWRLSVDAALAHPLLGVGPMHFAYWPSGEAAHPHNFWLQLAAEWGLVVALLAALGSACLWQILATRSRRQTGDELGASVTIVAFSALTAWMLGVVADGYMVIPTSQAASLVVLCLAAAVVRGSNTIRSSSGGGSRVAGTALRAVAAIAVTLLLTLPFTAFGDPVSREAKWESEVHGPVRWPRFWQVGWIGPDQDSTAR